MRGQAETLSRIFDLLERDTSTPWWAVELVQQCVDLANLADAQAFLIADMAAVQETQKATIDGLKTKYSEVLYKLKSGE